MDSLGKLLKRARKIEGLTQGQLGNKLGVTRQTIAKWEAGDIPPESIAAICDFVGDALERCDLLKRGLQAMLDVTRHNTALRVAQIKAAIDGL